MTEIAIGNPAPDFLLSDQDGNEISLGQFKGKWIVIYFYPKDDTPGCTTQANDFTNLMSEFDNQNTVILGVSADSEESHCQFRDKFGLTVELLSDPDYKVIDAYGAWQQKVKDGKESLKIIRTTILIGPDGLIAYHWPNVDANGHAAEVLEKIRDLT